MPWLKFFLTLQLAALVRDPERKEQLGLRLRDTPLQSPFPPCLVPGRSTALRS